MLMNDYFICPVCGAEVQNKALSCPECGSDDETGWSDHTIYDGIECDEFDQAFEASFGFPSEKKSIFQNKALMILFSLIALAIFILFYILL